MLLTPTTAANLLVPSALEALLSQSAHRLDLTARLQRLHAATLVECALKGHGDLKINEIAIRAKVSTASIYKTYQDRDELLVAAMETLFSILARDVIEIPQIDNPMKQVEHLLIAHGEVYAHPLSTWLFRLYASLASSGHMTLREKGSQIFHGIDTFWRGFLRQLIDQGHLVEFEPQHIVPQLLGPIERCTIVWQLGCGDSHEQKRDLAKVAEHGAQTLFSLWGKDALVQSDSGPKPLARAYLQVTTNALSGVATRLKKELAGKIGKGTQEDTADRLLLAAAVVCQECGYHKASMQEVSARAKVSTATLYKLFKDKADLFSTALERELKLRISLDPIEPVGDDSESRLANGLFAIAARAKDPEWVWMYYLIMASEISGTPRLIALAREHHTMTEALLKPVLASFAPPHPSNIGPSEAELALSTNFLLGFVERFGVFSLILFGEESCDLDELARFSAVAAANYARLQAS
jgi:AcrR family transcriptional regulator